MLSVSNELSGIVFCTRSTIDVIRTAPCEYAVPGSRVKKCRSTFARKPRLVFEARSILGRESSELRDHGR